MHALVSISTWFKIPQKNTKTYTNSLILEHAVLVDTALMCECVGADNGLVGLNHHAGQRRDELAAAVDFPADTYVSIGYRIWHMEAT
jgi:hypothetical protein